MGSRLAKMVRQGCIGGFDRLQQGNHGCRATVAGQVMVGAAGEWCNNGLLRNSSHTDNGADLVRRLVVGGGFGAAMDAG
ncbi:hypothetical protein ACFX13_002624 [Malus domestica]